MYINIKNTSLTYSEVEEIEGYKILTSDEIIASNISLGSGTRGNSEFWIQLAIALTAEKVLDETRIFSYFSEKVKDAFSKILNKFWRAKKEEVLPLLPELKEVKIRIGQDEETEGVTYIFVSESSDFELKLATFIEQLSPYLKEGAVIEIEE